MPRKHQPFTCSTTLQGPYPYQQIKVRPQPVANITKKHGGMHPRPVVPTKSGHSNLTGGKIPKREISPPLTFRLLQGNRASYLYKHKDNQKH